MSSIDEGRRMQELFVASGVGFYFKYIKLGNVLRQLLEKWRCDELCEKLLQHGFTANNLDEISGTTLLFLFGREAKYLGPVLKFQKEHEDWLKAKVCTRNT